MNSPQPLCPQRKRGEEAALKGFPAGWASVPPSAQWGELHPQPPRSMQQRRQGPLPGPGESHRLSLPRALLMRPPLRGPAWACLLESAVPSLGPSPAPPSLGPLLDGQGVRSEGPGPRAQFEAGGGGWPGHPECPDPASPLTPTGRSALPGTSPQGSDEETETQEMGDRGTFQSPHPSFAWKPPPLPDPQTHPRASQLLPQHAHTHTLAHWHKRALFLHNPARPRPPRMPFSTKPFSSPSLELGLRPAWHSLANLLLSLANYSKYFRRAAHSAGPAGLGPDRAQKPAHPLPTAG